MATMINPQVSTLIPATNNPAPASSGTVANSSILPSPASPPDLRKFNSLTSTRSAAPRGILGRPVAANVREINAGGVRGTPCELVEKVLEHEPPLVLLNEALRP